MAERISSSIARCIAGVAAGFERIDHRRGYWFRRFQPPLYSTILIQHSAKYHCFGVDVASSVFPHWDGQYGFHQLRRATGLANLRVRSNAINADDVLYSYKVDRQEALGRISDELCRFTLPWFDDHRRDIERDGLVQFGFARVTDAAAERITFDALKWSLRDEAAKIGASKWQRKETAILAADLLRMADDAAPSEPGATITVTQ